MSDPSNAASGPLTAEHGRLAESALDRPGLWKAIGPYLSERAWGSVREDYSADGDAWRYFPFEHARSRAYRWSEDGLAGVCDRSQTLCFALSLWNGRDPFLKERLFGLAGPEGNHGEDVKEYWWYADATPTASWLSWIYHYPQSEFPYARLRQENARRSRNEREFELADTGVFDDGRWWRIAVDYAKAAPLDLCVRIRIRNAGPETATLDVLPTLWWRNRWTWDEGAARPDIVAATAERADEALAIAKDETGASWRLMAGPDPDGHAPDLLFCENETNLPLLFGGKAGKPYPKDGINDHVVSGAATVNPERRGTKMAARYRVTVAAGAEVELRLRLERDDAEAVLDLGAGFSDTMAARQRDADEYYATLRPQDASDEEAAIMRQAFAGLIWSQQFYHFGLRALARRRSDRAEAARRPPDRSRLEMAPRQRPRHHRHAGQVGVPVVRRVGPLLPLRRARPSRSGGGEASAFAAVPRMVHASERPASRLRMGFFRRQPAGSGVGGAGGVPDRRLQGFRLPRARLPKAPDQFHLVGQPPGRARRQRVRGRLPRAGQYRTVRPLDGAARGRRARAIRRHRLDGEILPQHAGNSAAPRQPRFRPTRTSRSSSSSISPRSRRR